MHKKEGAGWLFIKLSEEILWLDVLLMMSSHLYISKFKPYYAIFNKKC